ncbi:MAG TPA: proton-conducting transporter membrane subunit [Kofleriaceae bacterium]|nr:proton-conducting transporter membrane subunit [Kofleriaceae bacterium]
MIEILLWSAIAMPLAASLALTVLPVRREHDVASIALGSNALSVIVSGVAIAGWFAGWCDPVQTPPHRIFSHGEYRFTLALVLDGNAAVFLALVQFITGMVVRFSRFYLHREPGFRRFFATVLLFQGAMCLLALAGNLDLMFAAWELVGISSFLLIAFYRERQSAIRNALKTYSVYRVADIGMLLAACLQGAGEHSGYLIGLLVLLAAMGKSAQFPFSFWVARAMEGPTPSSALFYGALSIHAGAYLLLRTFPLFATIVTVRICIGVIGVITAVLCSMFSRTRPTIKGQVAYASATQVGIIFVEIALGLTSLALVHVVSNALVRCYQLLVSPSVVAHRLRRQATAGAARAAASGSYYVHFVPKSWRPSLYVFALSEGYLKDVLKVVLWFPIQRFGRLVQHRRVLAVVVAVITVALGGALARDAALAVSLVAIAVAFSAHGLARWQQPARAVGWIAASSMLAMLAPAVFARTMTLSEVVYGGGIVLAYLLGFAGFAAAGLLGGTAARFAGRWELRPGAAAIAFIGALGLAGAPLWPTFWGEDLVIHGALEAHRALAVGVAAVLAANGYLAVRNFAYAFMGRPG